MRQMLIGLLSEDNETEVAVILNRILEDCSDRVLLDGRDHDESLALLGVRHRGDDGRLVAVCRSAGSVAPRCGTISSRVRSPWVI